MEQGGLDVGTFPNQAGVGDRPCRGFRALEEEVERSVGKGSGEGDRDSAKSQRKRCRWEAENGPSPVLTPGLERPVFSPDALRAEDIPAARGCEGVHS